jgi:NADH-quinone oxidoreductase subunit N
MLVAGSNDLIMLYLCFEFLSITSYIMVGWLRDQAAANEAAMKYLLYGAISSAIMLYGMSLLYGAAGSTVLTDIGAVFRSNEVQISPLAGIAVPALALMMAGFGFKIALVPFHQWSPDAYEGAPTPVAAFLSVGSKAAGFAILIRVLMVALPEYVAQWQTVLSVVAILTMTLGNLVALMQQNMKRMLAYSSIAQAGYILMGLVAVGSSFNVQGEGGGINGIGGLLIYLLAYLFTNVGVFIAVIAYEQATGSVTISDYAGMIRRAPWLAASLVIFFLSLAGLPPTAGFVGKFFVFGAAINQGFIFLAVVGVVNSVISVVYYFNVLRQMFFQPAADEDQPVIYPASLDLALGATVVGTLLMGLYPEPFLILAQQGQQFISMISLGLLW